jgi:zinc/manganese transport system permease protein
MTDALQLLLWPFVACLILTGIHAYLGLHVVERGVIFVDLSLAQVAALGSTCAILAGYDLHERQSYFFSLGFTLLGAAVFALTRSRRSKIPQEAFIGITYAVSAAASVLIMDRLPEGGEHIKHILVGNLLAVDQAEILKMALIYSIVGVLHWLWRKPLLAISTDHENKGGHPYNVRLWDFVFYATFGFVVTSSVAIAGVLLVFSFLIVPPVTAMLFTRRIGARLAFGWIMGAVVSFLGIYGSYHWDTPTGATVVCAFGAALLLLSAVRGIGMKWAS